MNYVKSETEHKLWDIYKEKKMNAKKVLNDVGKTILTIQEVVDEITNKRQLRRLVVLPYDLQLKDVFQENIKYKGRRARQKAGDNPQEECHKLNNNI
uniref:Ribonuclease PIN domain-containing protein n=1 Tax=Timema bartmani TaxID=61472 RepID=A0A7R9F211_9NEOP|nr:unnamed protein product [Timema bartmani]